MMPQAPVASVKRTVGHTMGAAAAFNLVAACLAVRRGKLSVTAGGGSDLPGLDVVRQARSATIDLAMVTCLAFGGVDAAIVVGSGDRCR
jgi:3-oxoacyl-(acyl-carrier-protein) synthase